MEFYLANRFSVDAHAPPADNAVLPAAFVGHCPGQAQPAALVDSGALDDIRRAGFGRRADTIEAWYRGELVFAGVPDELFHLPVPIRSSQQLRKLFAGVDSGATSYTSELAGAGAWLPRAVDDFFANGGEKLWIVRVPESGGSAEFGLGGEQSLRDLAGLRGVGVALAVDEIGLVALPDLERLLVPADLQDPDADELLREDPVFVPCGHATEAGPPPQVPVAAAPPPGMLLVLRNLLHVLQKLRPDVTCLYTLPLSLQEVRDSLGPDSEALSAIAQVRDSAEGPALRRLQLLFPYLRGVDGHIHSAVGVVAGKQAAVAERHGPWRSIAGQRLDSAARPFPALTRQQEMKLREEPGLSILTVQDGRTLLTDERLCVPALHPGDYNNTALQRRALAGYRSAEISRFIGYLLRQLRDLGDAMIFQVDPRDPRPGILLNAYFDRLYRRGALRGARATDAYQVRRMPAGDSVMRFDIEIAPAFPIDHVRLAFSQDGERWQARTADG